MGGESRYVVLLACSPLIVLMLHAMLSRLSLRRSPPAPPQAVAFLSMFAGYPALGAAAWWMYFRNLPLGSGWVWPGLFGILTYSGLAFSYLQVYNLSETARRIHILYELRRHGAMSREELEALYAPPQLLDIRLERLVSLGQLACVGDRYRLSSRFLWSVAWMMNLWARCIGYPSRVPAEG